MKTHYSNGKLLITGEYVVLDGALSLAVPTTYGQSLSIEHNNKQHLKWTSIDNEGNVWFEKEFYLDEILNQVKQNDDISINLINIFNAANTLNPEFLNSLQGLNVITQMDFPNNWGLGSSSTLINNIANWANVNPYKLLDLTFGGSGYDIACAQHNTAITYQLESNNEISRLAQNNKKKRSIKQVDFNPAFSNHLYFVHLNKKQNSREGIAQYKSNTLNLNSSISEISDITSRLISCTSLQDFNSLINAHEQIISSIIKQKPIKDLLFKDFEGSIKSLGAWGGDFILATSHNNPKAYFKSKGFSTVVLYKDMVL